MSLRIVVDMNLSIEWLTQLRASGYDAVHWSEVGSPSAPDSQIMEWARNEARTVLTHDLDFGTTLALTHSGGPSVLQIRTQLVLPEDVGTVVLEALARFEKELAQGALVVVERARSRVRILPLR